MKAFPTAQILQALTILENEGRYPGIILILKRLVMEKWREELEKENIPKEIEIEDEEIVVCIREALIKINVV